MKAWGDLPGDDPERDRAEKEAAIAEAGIDLDPTPPGSHRHGDDDHAATTSTRTSTRPRASRRSSASSAPARSAPRSASPSSRAAGRSTRSPAAIRRGASGSARWSTSSRVFADPEPILDEVELIILAVPDDAIAPLAGSLRMYGGQAMIHTSGALGAEVLAPAMAAGTQIGAFHPLVAFADTERAVAALHGATIAIEGDDQLAAMLADMAEAHRRPAGPPRAGLEGRLSRRGRPGRRRVRRPARRDRRARPGRRPRRGRRRWRSTARSSRGRSATPGPSGIRAALTGPMTRGDVGTLRRHLATLRAPRPGRRSTCTSPPRVARSTWPSARGALAPEDATKMRAVLATALQARPEPVP